MRLAQAMIFVADLPRMEEFYCRALGLEPLSESRTTGWVELQAGAATLGLHAIPPHLAAGATIIQPAEPREETPVKLIIEVADLATARGLIAAMGGVAVERPWGGIDGIDPEGNVFGLRAAATDLIA